MSFKEYSKTVCFVVLCLLLAITPTSFGDWSDPGSGSGGGVSDHGGLTGLSDDDHTQYLERDGSDTFAGDLVPDSDSSRSLGSTLVRWLNGWFDAITVGGNITVGGTVDGRDVAADGTTLDGIDTEAERYHNTSHAENAGDELLIENLGTACANGYVAVSDGSGGLECAAQSGGSGGCTWTNVGAAVTDAFTYSTSDTLVDFTKDGATADTDMVRVSFRLVSGRSSDTRLETRPTTSDSWTHLTHAAFNNGAANDSSNPLGGSFIFSVSSGTARFRWQGGASYEGTNIWKLEEYAECN